MFATNVDMMFFYESEGALLKYNLGEKVGRVTRGVKIAASGFNRNLDIFIQENVFEIIFW